MRLYLSSYRIGNQVNELLELVGVGRKVAIIENAQDNITVESRISQKKNFYDIHSVFKELGFNPENFDLRDYFNNNNIESDLKSFDLIWVCGGNVFLLRRAMQQSGFDKAIKKLLEQDSLAYGGWSAGVCVIGKTLKGFELCDNPNDIAEGYNKDIIWDGLGVIDFSIAPHYKSNHHESEKIEEVVKYFIKENINHVTLKDGEVIIYNP